MPVSDFTPTVADVAAFLRARTKTQGGAEAGTFAPAAAAEGSKTRPTAEQVASLIDESQVDIVGAFGSDIPDAPGDDIDLYRKAAARLWALGAALLVELTYFPEQIETNRSPYKELKALYDQRFKTLQGILGSDSDGDGVTDAIGAGYPWAGGFPRSALGMEHPW